MELTFEFKNWWIHTILDQGFSNYFTYTKFIDFVQFSKIFREN